jgi:hypothetical protein
VYKKLSMFSALAGKGRVAMGLADPEKARSVEVGTGFAILRFE